MKPTIQSANRSPIPPPADKLIAELEAGLHAIDQNWIDGIYVTGSIALDDFHPNKSDVDFLVLCKEFPATQVITQLDKLHSTIQKRHGNLLLNGTYLMEENLRISNVSTGRVLNLHEGKLTPGLFDMGPVALYELTTIARTVAGVPPNKLLIDVHPQQVNNFMHENINSYWQNWIDKHASYTNRRALLILFPVLTEWAVLGVARQLYTVQTGKIGSKTTAGRFCLDVVPAHYQEIIRQAIQIRKGNAGWFHPAVKSAYYVAPSFKRAASAIDCVNYIIELFNNVYAEQTNHCTGEEVSDET